MKLDLDWGERTWRAKINIVSAKRARRGGPIQNPDGSVSHLYRPLQVSARGESGHDFGEASVSGVIELSRDEVITLFEAILNSSDASRATKSAIRSLLDEVD